MVPGIRSVGICLRINTLLFIALALAAVGIIFYIPNIAENDPMGLIVMLVIIPTATIIAGISELTVRGLRRQRNWAWYTALVIMVGILLPLFLPIGVIGLWGLLRAETRQAFAVDR